MYTSFQEELQVEVTRLGDKKIYCLRIISPKGKICGLTSAQDTIVGGGVAYYAVPGLTVSLVDIFQGSGPIMIRTLLENTSQDWNIMTLRSGEWEGSELTLFLVEGIGSTLRFIPLKKGSIGRIFFSNVEATIEVAPLQERCGYRIGTSYSATCRAGFGDSRCRVNQEVLRKDGSVSSLFTPAEDNGYWPYRWIDMERTEGEGVFNNGTCLFLSGKNQGMERDVYSFFGQVVTLAEPLPFLPQIGDRYSLGPGCDKTFFTCKGRYNNAANFRGEPMVPIADDVL